MDLWVILKRDGGYILHRWALRPDGSVGADVQLMMSSDLGIIREQLPPGVKRSDSKALGVPYLYEAWF